MKIKSQRDFFAGLMFVALGVGFAVATTNPSLAGPVSPGARHMPLVLSLALAVLGGIVLFKALTLETEGGDPVGAIAWRALLVVVASVLGFGVVLPLLGLVLTIPLLTVLVSLAAGDFDWKAVLLSSVLLTLVSWAIFVGVLGRELPMRPVLFGG